MDIKYFNVEDFWDLPQEGQTMIKDWLSENEVNPEFVSLIQGMDGNVVVSGYPDGNDETVSLADVKIIKTIEQDTFPWEEISNFLAQKVVSESDA